MADSELMKGVIEDTVRALAEFTEEIAGRELDKKEEEEVSDIINILVFEIGRLTLGPATCSLQKAIGRELKI